MSDDQWIGIHEAAQRLNAAPRSVYRWAEPPHARLRKRKAGHRVVFNAADVDELARDLGAELRPRPAPPVDLLPAGELMQRVDSLIGQLNAASYRLGALETQLEAQKLLPQQAESLRAERDQARAERDAARAELEALRATLRPWWQGWQLWLFVAVLLAVALGLAVAAMLGL